MPSTSQKLMARHPLQRLESPSRSVSALVHLTGIISFTLSFKYLQEFPTIINASYGWHFQYLTILGLTVAYVGFITALLADITLSPTLFLIKNSLALCGAPLEVLISLLYWSISAIDKRLLIPPEVDLNPWADVGFHLMPSLLLVIDLLFLSPPWTIQATPAIALSGVLAVGYWWWVERCYSFNGLYVVLLWKALDLADESNSYPYPLLDQLDTAQRAVLFSGAAFLMTGSTFLLKWLYGRVNGLQGEQSKSYPADINGRKNV